MFNLYLNSISNLIIWDTIRTTRIDVLYTPPMMLHNYP